MKRIQFSGQGESNEPRRLSRREALALLGATGAASVAGCPSTSTTGDGTGADGADSGTGSDSGSGSSLCVVTPSETEGPYFVDERLKRSDIRSDPDSGEVQEGTPLRLKLTVRRIDGSVCSALEGADVDIWHCNADGDYSDVSANRSVGLKYLRGYQTTDANGLVEFLTIYPGWYRGRTVHIHFKVRTPTATGTTYEFTSQLFFDEGITAEVYAADPYAARGLPDTTNARDGIFRSATLLTLSNDGSGWLGTFEIGLQIT